MSSVFIIFAVLTLVVLIVGIIVMAKGGKTNKKLSNKLMALRVVFQALALAALAAVFLLMGK